MTQTLVFVIINAGGEFEMKFPEKLKLIRKANNLTQADFANSIGISRGNLANIELGKVEATQVFINCVSLMYNIDKNWLLDDSNNDLSALNGSTNILSLIMDKYEQLDDKYKKFVENQINQLLELQGQNKK
ncbi:helix-turn-helix domain-containing protein [Clostridium botulinum]|uniref:helix-turn-helix domain-containing protein n=2 Tax=Clostridium botulinum TaxID=1491 RepID=UPI001C9AF2BD|nr:helix-turn-helix transcriptional regulator [Clostridium botulinum]MBY6766482.1 helix-turn-helix transcriptional regulator [Clostridium botulinum]